MKSLAKKLTALLLITMMLLSTLATIVNAQGTDTRDNGTSTSEASIIGMSDILTASPTIIGDDTTTVTNLDADGDGTNDTLMVAGTTTATSGVLHAGSYNFSNASLKTDSQYVITFTLKKSSIGYASYLWIDPDRQYGFKFSNTQSANLNETSGSWVIYSELGITPETSSETIDGASHTCMHFKMIVDGADNTVTLMVRTNDGIYRTVNTDVFDISQESNLCLTFGALNNKSACFADVEVKAGEGKTPLLDMTDIFENEPTAGAATTTYTELDVDADQNPDLLKIDGSGTDYVKYNFSDICLDTDSQYIIKFTLKKYYIGNASYFWIDPDQQYGFRFSNTQSAPLTGTNFEAWTTYESKSVPAAVNKETIENLSCSCVYFKVIVDGPNDILRLMVLENGTYKEVNTDAFDLSSVNNLCLSFGETGDGRPAYFSDVLVYEAKKVNTVNGSESTETEALYDTYTLTSAKRTGYVLNGWKVNGGETIVPVGTVVDTVDLEAIEAVYTRIMSTTWYQFKDNGDGTKDIRVVSVIDSTDYSGIGYEVTQKCTIDGEEKSSTKTLALKNVYESITAKYGSEVVTLETLGFDKNGGYLTAFVIRNVRTDVGNVTVDLTPYQLGIDANEPTVGEKITVVFDVANEAIVK